MTAPRLALLAYLESNSTHPSAERLFADLKERHPSLSLSTVYKTLEAFLGAGLCRRIRRRRTVPRLGGGRDRPRARAPRLPEKGRRTSRRRWPTAKRRSPACGRPMPRSGAPTAPSPRCSSCRRAASCPPP
ncbi:MAG: hypothetical protein B7Z68_00515 [Acidobacteria bacterium 21-70-11]|nr:MAG: hypothetical protein B7Z68_00515 [Acidobacteria bacterium 21-70-11]OYW05481.1 MAG: hypothetical protein B7Z61_06055 [Acidobacteria bacterium 37-71-11]